MSKSASTIAAEWAATDVLVAIGIPYIIDLSDEQKDRVIQAYIDRLSDDEELTLRADAITSIERAAWRQAHGDQTEQGRLYDNALYEQLETILAELEPRAALQIDDIERANYGDHMRAMRAAG